MAEGNFVARHLLFTFNGKLPGGEIWTAGIRTVAAPALTDADRTDLTASMASKFRQFWEASSSLQVLNPSSVTYDGVTTRQVEPDGTSSWVGVSSGASDPGQAASQGAPNQTALVFTLRTALPGRRGTGRMYLPLLTPQFTAGTDALLPAMVTALATAFSLFITSYNSSLTSAGAPVPQLGVQSRVLAGAQEHVITRIAVGNVVDTQRRRRNKVKESYVTVDVD